MKTITSLLFISIAFNSFVYSSDDYSIAILREWAAYSGISDSTFKIPVITEGEFTYVASVDDDPVTGVDIVLTKYDDRGG
jgi:hypothetical protein